MSQEDFDYPSAKDRQPTTKANPKVKQVMPKPMSKPPNKFPNRPKTSITEGGKEVENEELAKIINRKMKTNSNRTAKKPLTTKVNPCNNPAEEATILATEKPRQFASEQQAAADAQQAAADAQAAQTYAEIIKNRIEQRYQAGKMNLSKGSDLGSGFGSMMGSEEGDRDGGAKAGGAKDGGDGGDQQGRDRNGDIINEKKEEKGEFKEKEIILTDIGLKLGEVRIGESKRKEQAPRKEFSSENKKKEFFSNKRKEFSNKKKESIVEIIEIEDSNSIPVDSIPVDSIPVAEEVGTDGKGYERLLVEGAERSAPFCAEKFLFKEEERFHPFIEGEDRIERLSGENDRFHHLPEEDDIVGIGSPNNSGRNPNNNANPQQEEPEQLSAETLLERKVAAAQAVAIANLATNPEKEDQLFPTNYANYAGNSSKKLPLLMPPPGSVFDLSTDPAQRLQLSPNSGRMRVNHNNSENNIIPNENNNVLQRDWPVSMERFATIEHRGGLTVVTGNRSRSPSNLKNRSAVTPRGERWESEVKTRGTIAGNSGNSTLGGGLPFPPPATLHLLDPSSNHQNPAASNAATAPTIDEIDSRIADLDRSIANAIHLNAINTTPLGGVIMNSSVMEGGGRRGRYPGGGMPGFGGYPGGFNFRNTTEGAGRNGAGSGAGLGAGIGAGGVNNNVSGIGMGGTINISSIQNASLPAHMPTTAGFLVKKAPVVLVEGRLRQKCEHLEQGIFECRKGIRELEIRRESELSEAAGTKELLTRRIQQTEDDRIKLEEKELPGLVLEMTKIRDSQTVSMSELLDNYERYDLKRNTLETQNMTLEGRILTHQARLEVANQKQAECEKNMQEQHDQTTSTFTMTSEEADRARSQKKQLEVELERTVEMQKIEMASLENDLERVREAVGAAEATVSHSRQSLRNTRSQCEGKARLKIEAFHAEKMERLRQETELVRSKVCKIRDLNERMRGRGLLER